MPAILMILDFIPSQQRSFETYLLRLTRELRRKDWKSFFLFAGEPSEGFASQLRAQDAEYRVQRFPLQPHAIEPLIVSMSAVQFQAMSNAFVSCFDPVLLTIKNRLRIPHWLVHDHSSGLASSKSGIKLLLAKVRGWYYGRHIDRVLAVSEFVARRDCEQTFLPRDRVRVLPNGVDLDRFRPSSNSPDPDSDRPLIVYAGQLIAEKGVRTLLHAMQLIQERSPHLVPELQIAGQGPLDSELRRFVTANGMSHVQFLGQVSDLSALYRAASVVVVPSEWAEAFGLVVAEAMACGACVLGSTAGAIPDVIGHDEEGGRLFRSGDANDLATKLLELLAAPAKRAKLRVQARARAERLFGIDNMVNGFIRELEDVTRSA